LSYTTDSTCDYLKETFDNVIDVVYDVEKQFYIVKIQGLKIMRRKTLTDHRLKIFHLEGQGKNAILWLGDENRVKI
jgi:hypothetical protein